MSSKLTFSIEESLWLNRGQEISEVMSMSLEPNISIQEMQDHIVIRGGLLLQGQYRPVEQDTNEEDFVDDDVKMSSHRLAKEVTFTEEGIGEVKHFIPIDVTIPVNRIQNLEDIYVHIDSFDYDLPEKSCIQLTADITISGMSETELQPEPTYGEVNPYPTLELESFRFEARRPFMSEHDQGDFTLEEEEDDSLDVQTLMTEEQEEAVEENEAIEQELEEEQNQEPLTERTVEEEEEQEPLVLEVREEQELISEQEVEQLEQEEEVEEVEEVRAQEILPEPEAVEVEIIEQQEEHRSEIDLLVNIVDDGAREAIVIEDEDIELSESEEEEVEEREDAYSSRTEENALYLTKMLQNGEERFSKLKMCIIQENESLSTIAERYNLSTSQLIRANRLEEETVTEGQILYIPVAANR